MADLNKVMLIGRLGFDPELKNVGNTVVCTMRVATSEKWKDKASGQMKERTEWHRVVVWGRQGETCAKFLKKGRMAYFEGSIRTREWEDRDKNKRKTSEVIAKNVQFLGGGPQSSPLEVRSAPPGTKDAGFDTTLTEDEIPF